MQLFRIILGLLLLLVGTLLGDGYKNDLYLLWLVSAAFLLMYSEFITMKLLDSSDQLDKYKDKVSTLTMLKGNGSNIIQMSIFPNSKVIVSREVKIDLFITSAVPMSNIPDIKMKTDSEWLIKISNQVQNSKYYAGRYEYILINSIVNNVDGKFIQFSFSINVNTVGQHNLSIELDNGSISGELKTSIIVNQT